MNMLDSRILRDWLTGLDGETFALGKGLGIVMFVVGLVLAVGVTIYAAITAKSSLGEWGAYLTGLGAYLVTVSAGAWALIRGTNANEPPAPTTVTTTTTGATA